jgi:hypothetical protein
VTSVENTEKCFKTLTSRTKDGEEKWKWKRSLTCLTSHNRIGLHGLLRGIAFFILSYHVERNIKFFRIQFLTQFISLTSEYFPRHFCARYVFMAQGKIAITACTCSQKQREKYTRHYTVTAVYYSNILVRAIWQTIKIRVIHHDHGIGHTMFIIPTRTTKIPNTLQRGYWKCTY